MRYPFAAALAALSIAGSAPLAVAQMATSPAGDIVEVAQGAGKFTTLVTALKAANLVDALKGNGPFTVFAPTDEAFAKLPAGALDNLLANPAKLAAVLKYHVVSGRVMAKDVVGLQSAKTLEGQAVPIKVMSGKVMVGKAHVTATDIAASNGVIHVIDTVILPPS